MALSIPKIHEATLKLLGRHKIKGRDIDVLDVGSGHGELLVSMRDFYKTSQVNARFYGCDYTKELLTEKTFNLSIVDLNECALPFADNSFDVITMTEVVEHIENHRAVFRELYRIMKRGGVLDHWAYPEFCLLSV